MHEAHSDLDTDFAFTVASVDTHFRVLSFRGREAVSEPFAFDIDLTVAAVEDRDLESEMLGQPASLFLRVPGLEPRVVHGIVARVEAHDAFEQQRHVLRTRLVPRLWLLRRRKTSRVFQDMTVPGIVRAVLGNAGVPHRSALVKSYRPRTYCVQYQETDLEFMDRLLADEGIFYHFAHGEKHEEVVLCDSPHTYSPIAGDGRLAYRYEHGSDGMVPKEHQVTRFGLRRELKSDGVLERAYDFRRPTLDLRAEVSVSSTTAESGRVYEHRQREDEQPDVDERSARTRLEQARRRAAVARGRSACRRLSPCSRFTLADHELEALNRSYALASVEHEGQASEVSKQGRSVYSNTFACVPDDVPLRPLPPERQLRQIVETAMVVGPPGEEIHVDEHGRVKVQFHWDLRGRRDDHSSCWLRVMQPWAGQGFGAQFIPRVGTEVIVSFVAGDIDLPVILGCLYNAHSLPPFPLPGAKAATGIRTETTPGGGGHNELRFADDAGHEEVFLRAQRDLRQVVLHDREATVGGQDVLRVAKSRTVAVGGDEMVGVAGSEVIEIGGDIVLHVKGRSYVVVEGSSASGAAQPAAELMSAPRASFPVGEGGGSGHGGGGGGDYDDPFDRKPRAAPQEDPKPPVDDDPFRRGNGSGSITPPKKQPKESATTPSEVAGDRGNPGSPNPGPPAAKAGDMPPQPPLGGSPANQPEWKGSKVRIDGGGEIVSPDGLRLVGEGCAIEMKGGVMTMTASKIVIKGGVVDIKGEPINLN